MTKKLDKEHLEAITKLRDDFAQNARQLGTLIIEQEFLETQRKSLDEARVSLLNDFSALREEENKLIEDLKERYGDGQINIQDGTFTPTE